MLKLGVFAFLISDVLNLYNHMILGSNFLGTSLMDRVLAVCYALLATPTLSYAVPIAAP